MLKTKLNRPKLPSKLTVRKEVIDILENGKHKKLALVSAPAGYGKSTLVSQWIDQNDFPHSWYSLDKSDNDIYSFLQYTIAGIQSVYKTIGTEAIKLMESNSNPSFETIATHVINDLYEIQEQFYIIFDDYHLIENQQINQLISFLLDKLPDNIQIVLITRSDPSIPLARLRSQQLVTDIRLSDLCFNANNIYDFFKKCLNINLSIDDAQSLESKTEGWIAGLQLTGLSLQGKEDVGDFVNKLKGDNRYIMDYLIEEVLQQHSQEIRDFLLCTSILNHFNASLCNHILNIQNGQEIIEELERKNMFIVPLDNEGNWFRYHHLFASLLQHQLSVKLKDRIPELHANASQWFENNEQFVFALKHALCAGNKQKALSLFADIIVQLWESSQYITILQFGGMFTPEELIVEANVCFYYFWVLFESGEIKRAESLITMLQDHTTDKAELSRVYVCLNNLKAFTGDIESAYEYSELATQNISEDDGWYNVLAFLSQGESYLLRFELSKSYQSFDHAAARASKAHIMYMKMISLARASFVLWTLGEYSESYNTCKNLLDEIKASAENSFGADLLSSIMYCLVGKFLIDINQVEEGLQKCLLGYDLSKKTNNASFIATCNRLLAEAYYLAGDYNKAISLIEDLDAHRYKQTMIFMSVLSDSLKSKLYFVTNKPDKLKPLFEKDIKADKNHAFERIVDTISRARYLMTQGDILEAIDILQEITEEIKAEKAYGSLTEVEILQARAHSLIQEQEKATDYLLNAVLQTQSAGLIRMYINEGAEIETLLKNIKQIVSTRVSAQFNKVDVEYINRLLRVYEKEKTVSAITSEDTLSIRELDTLKLIAENLTNQEIAEALYISITTVKTHVRNILLKLEAKNRNEAVSKAKEKGMLH